MINKSTVLILIILVTGCKLEPHTDECVDGWLWRTDGEPVLKLSGEQQDCTEQRQVLRVETVEHLIEE